MDKDARFGKLWENWDARLAAGEPTKAILNGAKDEDLLEILAGESPRDRKYARDIIATELLNRLRSRSASHPSTAQAVAESARGAHDSAKDGAAAIHRAEGILKKSGEWALGAAVSASAYANVDAAKAAFDGASEHAASLQGSLSQSRHGSELADDAAKKAGKTRDLTRGAEGKMETLGRGKEGRDATKASQTIKDAADEAATDVRSHDEEKP